MSHQAEARVSDRRLHEINDAVSPEAKAKQLLHEILSQKALQELLEKDYFHYEGKNAVYRIRRGSQTQIYRNGRLVASACLQLTVPAPAYDRMVAEYLILSNDEWLYWTKAIISPVKRSFDFRLLAITILDAALLLKLALDYLM